jgi:uncharacterized flavoprotein (TIGR03862 family)
VTATENIESLVIGGGPAGLMAASALAATGRGVIVADAMPSMGRKFLMAGKSGLNLTKDEPFPEFADRFAGGSAEFHQALNDFGPRSVMDWSNALGQPVFTGSTGRVFPQAMKASPLLRAWLASLRTQGVDLRTRWRWVGWENANWLFQTPDGPRRVAAGATVLALGGASWRRLGSDGRWAELFATEVIPVTPFTPANVGIRIDWSDHMARHFGVPVKGVRLIAGDTSSRGEWVITPSGIEGGGVYEIDRNVRAGEPLSLDLMPDLTVEEIATRLNRNRGKASVSNHLRKVLKMSPVHRALLMEWARPLPSGDEFAARIKQLPVPVAGLMPLDKAISTAGGVSWAALDGFMLKSRPGTFVAGEMLDWEAPTGGYLLTACLATGRAAGIEAAAWLDKR